MPASATETAPHDDPVPHATDTRGHGAALDDLIHMGTGIARFLHDHAAAQAAQPALQAAAPAPQAMDIPTTDPQPAPAPLPDTLINTAAAFDDIARTVRRCIMLAQSLDTPKQPARAPAPDRTTARKLILRAVEDTSQRKDYDDSYADCDSPEVLTAELRERMDAPDLDENISSRPVEDIIRDILRDFGIAALPGSRPWKRRTLAELNARSAAPSRPTGSTLREPAPQDPRPGATQHLPAPQPGQPEPGEFADPAATSRVQFGPIHPRPGSPEDPAKAVTSVPHQSAHAVPRWRPPPGG